MVLDPLNPTDISNFETTKIRIGTDSLHTETQTIRDWLGRVYTIIEPTTNPEFPNDPQSNLYRHIVYSYAPSTGKLLKEAMYLGNYDSITETDPLVAPTLYEYDESIGELRATIVDVNNDGVRNNGGNDKISLRSNQYKIIENDLWYESENKIMGMTSLGEPIDLEKTISIQRQRITFTNSISTMKTL